MSSYTSIETFNIGIKKNKKDAVCMKLPEKANTVIVTTKNKFAAAPVQISKKHIKKNKPKYLLINSGNANACTGLLGMENAKKCCQIISKNLRCKPSEVLIFSTGIIGEQLPIDKMLDCINKRIFKFKSSWSDAATAIMTTDRFKKITKKRFNMKNQNIMVTGICKGAGMIEPNMATMLAFIEINVQINQKLLLKLLKNVADNSFNRISVDGDMSTNDCIALIANGENDKINFNTDKQSYIKLEKSLIKIAKDLSRKIVTDGEGATKDIDISVINAKNDKQAEKITLAIANSSLVKTALYGSDPNWGRILAKVGSIYQETYNIKKITLALNGHIVFKKGAPSEHYNINSLKKSMKKRNIIISLDLCSGKGSYSLITADLSKKYVHINSAYSS